MKWSKADQDGGSDEAHLLLAEAPVKPRLLDHFVTPAALLRRAAREERDVFAKVFSQRLPGKRAQT